MKKADILLLSAAFLFAMVTGCGWSDKAKGGVIGAAVAAPLE